MNRKNSRIKLVLSAWGIGLMTGLLALSVWASPPVTGAVSTTVNEAVDGTGHCKNGNPNINCNIYDGKQYVWLSGLPDSAGVNDGTYFFAVVVPGGQGGGESPNDCTPLDLSDVCVTTNTPGGDSWTNRVFTIANGVISYGGTHTFANNKIRLMPYDDTTNPGGVYIMAVCKLPPAAPDTNAPPGSVPSECKYDAFKIQKSENVATVNVCKFDDQNGSYLKDASEPLLPAWVIDATGAQDGNGNTVSESSGTTDQTGCVTFTVGTDNLNASKYALTFAEVNQPGWVPTGAYSLDCAFTENDGVVTLTPPLSVGNTCTVYFGNFNVQEGGIVSVTKTVQTDDITWGISKDVDQTRVNTTAGASVTFNYTVKVTHTDPATLTLHGVITLGNSKSVEVQNLSVTDVTDQGGTCTITAPTGNGTQLPDGSLSGVTIPAGGVITTDYSCTFANIPASGLNTVSVLLNDTEIASDVEAFTFSNASVNVTDPVGGGALGTVSVNDPSPKTFTYSRTVTAPSGTCNTYDNTATITETGQAASQTVKVCGGVDLTASKTATASYDSSISKKANQTSPVEVNGTATLSYTVTVTESGWKVAGVITVNNPNDWEAVSVNLADALSDVGGSCTITGGSPQTVAASSSITPSYSCTFAAAPSTTSGTNTATITWDKAAYFTPNGSASGSANYTFASLTVQDTFNGGTPVTLGTIAGNVALTTYTPSYTVTVPPGTCALVPNVASIVGGGSSQADVTVCNTNTGALTMGFWKNPNGQGIIKNYCGGTSGTPLATYLGGFHPFSDAGANSATCQLLATYVSTIISAAKCTSSDSTCNPMLRAQMLATALDVYFSTPSLGGNRIGAYNGLGNTQPAIGGVNIDLTKICPKADGGFSGTCGENVSSAFGGATCMKVSSMLSYQNTSDPLADKGAVWYGQVKAQQVLAKDAFDAINNLAAGLCP